MKNEIEVVGKHAVIDSRKVAEMVGKDHAHLCRDIAKYIAVISTNPKLVSLNFFSENSYVDKKGESRKCYDITKQGCEMIANKLTGEKGILFTAEYVNLFNSMEQSLRKPDSYMIDDPIERAKRWIEEQQERKALAETCTKQEQVINELKPKADYVDRILKSKSLVAITAIAKDYGMSGRKMNEVLHDLKVIYKMGQQWLLYSRYQACGYTASETVEIERSDGRKDIVLNTKWTQKGRLFLYDLLKSQQILPVIERG